MNWKNKLFSWSERILKQVQSPLLAKEMAWRGVVFAAKCGASNPVSFALRQVAMHPRWRAVMGVAIAITTGAAAVWGPIPTGVDAGGKWGVPDVLAGEISLKTEESVVEPVENYRVSQGYGWLHSGVDMAAKKGEEIKPVMAGVVVKTEKDRWGYGQHVIVEHKNGFQTLYAHLSKIEVKVGDEVATDSVLGEVGSTGRSTGPHLHLEIRQNGRLVNPAQILGIGKRT